MLHCTLAPPDELIFNFVPPCEFPWYLKRTNFCCVVYYLMIHFLYRKCYNRVEFLQRNRTKTDAVVIIYGQSHQPQNTDKLTLFHMLTLLSCIYTCHIEYYGKHLYSVQYAVIIIIICLFSFSSLSSKNMFTSLYIILQPLLLNIIIN